MASASAQPAQGSYDEPPPPYGWIKQIDEKTGHPFWVDTTTNPPRAIWVHPYDDPQFLSEHPEIRDQLAQAREERLFQPPPGPPPGRDDRDAAPSGSQRRSYEDGSARLAPRPTDEKGSRSQPSTPAAGTTPLPHKDKDKERGFFGKLKDKAIGTKEERAEWKRQAEAIERQREQRRQEVIAQMMEQSRQQQAQRGRLYDDRGLYGRQDLYGRQSYGTPGAWGSNTRVVYASPGGDPYNDGYGRGYYAGPGGRRRGLGQGGGLGLPLLGGLVGGLLLGDVLDGGF